MTLLIVADPLATARRDRPYHFRFEEHSSGSTVAGHGQLARPFDPRELQSTLEASGEDLKDLYFLLGVNFPDTGSYRASGQMQRSGLRFTFTEVQGKSGGSDIAGTVHIDSTSERTQVTADLHSRQLHRADLGKRAAGRATGAQGGPAIAARYAAGTGQAAAHGLDLQLPRARCRPGQAAAQHAGRAPAAGPRRTDRSARICKVRRRQPDRAVAVRWITGSAHHADRAGLQRIAA